MSNAKNNTSTPSVTPTIAQEASALPEAERQKLQDQIESLQKQLAEVQNTKTETQTASVSVQDLSTIYGDYLGVMNLAIGVVGTGILAIGAIFAWIGHRSLKTIGQDIAKEIIEKEITQAVDKRLEDNEKEYADLLSRQKEQAAELAAQSKRIEIEHHLLQGHSYSSRKEWSNAIEHYGVVIKGEPNNVEAHTNRAYCRFHLKKYKGVIADLDIVIGIEPDNVYAHSNRALSLARLKRYDGAIKGFDRAIKCDPEYASAYYNKACAYALMDKPVDEILELLEKAISLDPTSKSDAREDEDFVSLRDNPEFRELVGLPKKK